MTMKLGRFLKRLNCFGFGQRKLKSRKHMERELWNMLETAHRIEEDIMTSRSYIEDHKRKEIQQKDRLWEAHNKERTALNTRQCLMYEVEQAERELGCELEARQMMMSEIIECGLRKMTLEQKLAAVEKKFNFYWMQLHYNDPDPRKTLKKWRENLRLTRSQNEMHKAVPQPPLFPILDFDDDEIIWMANYSMSVDDVNPEDEAVRTDCEIAVDAPMVIQTYL